MSLSLVAGICDSSCVGTLGKREVHEMADMNVHR